MREIKFRAWDGKKMLLPDYCDDEDFYITCEGDARRTAHNSYDTWTETARGLTLMQFTGLRDKDGKEIYEGDRLICTMNGEPIGEPDWVQFKDGEFCLANRNRSLRYWLYTEEIYGTESECDFIVDGNIYENPDLC